MKSFPNLRMFVLLPAGALALSSCATLPLSERKYISQPGMLFDGTGAARYECNLLTQVETGRSGSGGAAGSACSACH